MDEAVKVAAQGLALVDACKVPLCKAALKTQLARHYLASATISGTSLRPAGISNSLCHTLHMMCNGRKVSFSLRCHYLHSSSVATMLRGLSSDALDTVVAS